MEKGTRSIMFYEICRLCLNECGHCDIFEKDSLVQDIYLCTGVKVTLTDNLPQKICSTCLNIVNKAKELSITAKKNDCHLRTLFSDYVNEKSKDSTEDLGDRSDRSLNFETENRHPAIEKYIISVRKDLFESSVPEDSIVKDKPSQDDRSQNTPPEIKPMYRSSDTEYKCTICSKKFHTSKKLYLHNRLHYKNYECPINMCGKRFSTRGDVQKHVRTHTGEKPFQCSLCDKSFSQRVTLKAHKESIHSVG